MKKTLLVFVTLSMFFIFGIYSAIADDNPTPNYICLNLALEMEIPKNEVKEYVENCIIDVEEMSKESNDNPTPKDICLNLALEMEIPENEVKEYVENCTIDVEEMLKESISDEEIEPEDETTI